MQEKTKTWSLPVWMARVCGVERNCSYPDYIEVTDVDKLKKALSKDHVFIKFKDCYRGKDNFEETTCIVQDCDNDHSEDERDWLRPEDVISAFSDVSLIIYTSRHHLKPKGTKSARPRFHVIFFTEKITSAKEYTDFLDMVQSYYPYFDTSAQDAARFFFGNPDAEVYVHQGVINLSQYFDVDPFADMDVVIEEGRRNATMHLWAVRAMKRCGNTDKTKDKFFEVAANCNPPLDNKELSTIWRSAEKFYRDKIASDPDYVLPDVYEGKAVEFDTPIPFTKAKTETFPIETLPEDIARFVIEASESTQTPVDMAGTIAISILSLCLQGKYVIRGKADWHEPLNTYALEVAKPSERKSAILHLALAPVDGYETRYNRENAARVEKSKMRRRILEKQQKAIEDQVAKGKAEKEDMERIAEELADFEEERPLQMYVDDVTTEKLVSVLSDNHGHAALISSEGGIFDMLSGVYSKKVNIDVMLKGYSGDTIRVDRVGRESESVMNPSLTVLLMAQPSVVSEVLGNKTFRGRGLTARFLYCIPDSIVGKRRFDSKPVSEEAYLAYERLIINLLEDEYKKDMEVITLSDEAEEKLKAFADEVEKRIVTDLADLADWAGKLVGNTLRIAGLLCRASTYLSHDFINVNEPLIVSGEVMDNAIKLGEYYLSHAKAAYSALPEDLMYENATMILSMIREQHLKEFSRRDVMRNLRSFKRVEDVQPVLDFLEDYGYITRKPEQGKSSGRPPLPRYLVRPNA